MDKLIENYRELFRTLNRLHNTNKGLLLKGDIERLERAREILNSQQSDERRIVTSDERSGLHKHCVNGCAYKNALIAKTESMQEFARQNYGSVYYEGLLNGMRNIRVHIEKLYEKHCR